MLAVHRFGPADRVTLVRAVLACVVAGLVAASTAGPVPVPLLVGCATVALLLDAVDGWVARRTGTASAFGARFDMETDAFLIGVLSLYVAPRFGWWVLLIGLLRYLFLAAGWVLGSALPWLRGTAPPRPWCKVVAAIQGIVLTVAAAGVLPAGLTRIALAIALGLLLESFGREAVELYRLAPHPRKRPRAWVTALAFVLVWAALVFPNRLDRLTPGGFLRVPVEGVVLVVVAVLLGARWRRALAIGSGLLLGAVVIVKVLDVGFYAVFDRPFDLLNDEYYLGPGIGVLHDTNGGVVAVAAVLGAVAAVLAVLVALPVLVLRVTDAAARKQRVAIRGATALAVAWVIAAVAGTELVPGEPVASRSASAVAYGQVSRLRADLADRRTFDRAVAVDPWAGVPDDALLTGLRGKDVLLLFVESYGRVAVQGSSFAPGVNRVLESGTDRLRAAGYGMRSAFLTSPTFGAGSWLAHATLQSGLWVDSQQRYDQLLTRDRLTLTSAFGRAGWRTVVDDPANTIDWPQGRDFYGFDQLYDARNVGYAGPRFSYATMPDQYTLAAFHRLELAPRNRSPVMAEIDLISSHHPWTPLPHLVPWSAVGDGSVFDPMPAQGESPDRAFRDADKVREFYGKSIEYTLSTIVGYLLAHTDPRTVVVMVGDHQPHSYVSGTDPGHDVPISIIARDPQVISRVSGWGWRDGLAPDPDAPVRRMDAFRDQFLEAFSAAGLNNVAQEGSTS